VVDFDSGREERLQKHLLTGGEAYGGITVRDYFAARAIKQSYPAKSPEHIARIAYEIADAMLKQREYTSTDGMDIFQLNLTTRAYNALKDEGIRLVGELTTYSSNEILKLPNVGRDTLKIIQQALQEIGLTLNDKYPTVEEAFGL
jgi:DNA-directed RNA polymerase alpha subunit